MASPITLQRTQELKPNYSVEVQVNGKTVATKKFTAADALAPATTVTLNESQLAPGDNQVRIAKTGDGRVYWSTRGEYYSNESKVVNTGSFKLSVAREYYKLTSQQKGDKICLSPRHAVRAGAGGRHAGSAHHRRRQRLEVSDDRRPDSVGHGIDCARRSV